MDVEPQNLPNGDAGAAGAEADRLAMPVDTEQAPRLPFPVVGVGASAGGLEAVSRFLDALPPECGLAFVVIQHLPPDRDSLMAEILGRRTSMRVTQVEDGEAVEPNCVYVTRPGHVVTIRDGRLHLGPKLNAPRSANRPIDDFYRSLAEEQRELGIAVILSGMGSNGTAGAQAIKAVGGLCIAQSPESAQFPSMPEHLIDSGYADFILAPDEMPDVLLSYARQPYAQGDREVGALDILRRDGRYLREILAVLRTRTRQDFSGYKKPTLFRRVQRRMGLARIDSMADYARVLRQSQTEVTALADDMLIHVTGFFRDPDSWEALRSDVIVPLVAAREAGGPIRAWVTACSSGEEAYSLAMLLIEEADRLHKALDIKIFATDLAERSLTHARAGLYPGGIESEIDPERLERFFTRDDAQYRVRPDLRDRVVFAPQNLLQDPPFSRLDIVTCRNLLIYLEPEVQQRVLSLLHFGLREGGALFLGSTEAVSGGEGLFETINKKARIFRRVGLARAGLTEMDLPPSLPIDAIRYQGINPQTREQARLSLRRTGGRQLSIAQLTYQALLEGHTPPAVTVDRDYQIQYYHGDTRPYLQQPTGEPTRDLMTLAREGVRGASRQALQQAMARNDRATVTEGWIDLGPNDRRRIAVTASPVAPPIEPEQELGAPDYFVVSFDERGPFLALADLPEIRDEANAEITRRLRSELQSTIEELQSRNEELQSSNEEAMSTNEELQSTNEELETSKEEMQSLNEELTTVNAQLRVKMEEHQATSSDLASLLASTDLAVLFLDTSFRIRRYTPAFRNLVDLITSDVGRPLSALARRFDDPNLDEDARAVMDRLAPVEREVAGADGRFFLRRVSPYRTTDNRIEGVVLTFIDITTRLATEASLREARDQLQMALAAARMGIWIWDQSNDTHWRDANLNRLMGLEPVATVESTEDFLRMVHPDDRAAVAAVFAESSADPRPLSLEFRFVRPDGAIRWLRDQGDAFVGAPGRPPHMIGACLDITDLKEAQGALVRARDELEARVAERTVELSRANQALTGLLHRVVTAQEDERRRVSRELHDVMGQELVALGLGLTALGRLIPDDAPARERLREVERVVDQIIREAHALAVELRPTSLDDVGVGPAVSSYVAQWAERTDTAVDFQTPGLDGDRLPPEVETTIYRVVQESLNNVAKHAKADRVSVIVERRRREVIVIVEDNGRGFAVSDSSDIGRGRLGLLGMRERVSLLGGTFLIESAEGQGTTVRVRIPLPSPQEADRAKEPDRGK